MKSYYSIISASIRPQIGESVSIGLCLIGKDEVFVDFSKQKISIVRQLMTENRFNGLNASIRDVLNAKITIENESLLNKSGFIKDSSFSKEQLNYFSHYNNNIILFSKPAILELDGTPDLYNRFFQKYVDSSYPAESINGIKEQNSFYYFKREKLKVLKPYYNTDYRITSELYPNLLMPVKLDILGRNAREVFGKSINLERRVYHVREDMANLLILDKAIEDSKKFVISSEPDKLQFPTQHGIWNDLRSFSDYEYVDLSEAEKLEEYATSHGVLPLFEEE